MFEPVAPEAYVILRPMFAACFLMWAFLWMRVAYYYGTAAYASWLLNGGRWRNVFYDLFQPFWWAIKQTVCRWKFFRGASFCGVEVPAVYESGHLLRFSIFLGSMTPISFGLQFAELDRSTWTYFKCGTTLFFASVSILAAGGHLFLAFRSRPEAWRRLVIRCTAWLLFSPAIIGIYYQLTGWHLLPWASM